MGAMLDDDQRLRLRQIEHLPGDKAGCHRRGQPRTARGTIRRVMVEDRIRRLTPAQRLAWVPLLPTGPFTRSLPQTADPRRLVQSIAGWRLAAVAAVQPKTALQLGNACFLRQQQRNQVVFREMVERSAIHRLLRIAPPKSCQPNSQSASAQPAAHPILPTPPSQKAARTWAVTPDLAKGIVADRPNQLWVAALTYVAIPGGFVYLAAILDAWSRKVVGYAIGRSMDAHIAVAALKAQSGTVSPPRDVSTTPIEDRSKRLRCSVSYWPPMAWWD